MTNKTAFSPADIRTVKLCFFGECFERETLVPPDGGERLDQSGEWWCLCDMYTHFNQM